MTTETTTWNDAIAASAEASFPAPTTRHAKERIPVPLTEHELAELGKKAADARNRLADFEASKKADLDAWKEKISAVESERDTILDQISRGTEDRLVDVVIETDYRLGTAKTILAETGEVLRERALEGDERQMTLLGSDTGNADPIDVPDFDDAEISSPQAVLDAEPGEENVWKREKALAARAAKKATKKGKAS